MSDSDRPIGMEAGDFFRGKCYRCRVGDVQLQTDGHGTWWGQCTRHGRHKVMLTGAGRPERPKAMEEIEDQVYCEYHACIHDKDSNPYDEDEPAEDCNPATWRVVWAGRFVEPIVK